MAVSTTACSEKKLAVIVDVAGLVSGSLPRAPVCHNLSDRTSCIFLLSILNLAPSSNLRHINRIEFRGCSGLVSGVVFELGSSFVHVSDPVGVICKLGVELPFASMFNEIGMDC